MTGATTARTPAQLKRTRSNIKPNGSILDFFRKAEPSKNNRHTAASSDLESIATEQQGLFVQDCGDGAPRRDLQRSAAQVPPHSRSNETALDAIDRAGTEPTWNIEPLFDTDTRSSKRRCGEGVSRPSDYEDGWSRVGHGLQDQPDLVEALDGSGLGALGFLRGRISANVDKDCSSPPKIALPSHASVQGEPRIELGVDDMYQEDVAPRRDEGKVSPVPAQLTPSTNEPEVDGPLEAEVALASRTDDVERKASTEDGLEHGCSANGGLVHGDDVPNHQAEGRETAAAFDDDEWGTVDFEDAEFGEGEELLERQMAEEELRAEMAESGVDEEEVTELISSSYRSTQQPTLDGDNHGGAADRNAGELHRVAEACPICNGSLVGLNDHDAQLHVNHCLDGTPLPLPKAPQHHPERQNRTLNANRFQRPTRPAKPGQANPFVVGSGKGSAPSAFSKLMSSHTEDAAWATAAAAEHAARGKPAFQRTCPFYKILPGFSICVDAFRYGAVEGCQAYFLSHFHSDHYVGLTSSWAHGPIYCSRITGNLVRQQLRVDPRFVVDLEFERTVDVPGTSGAQVTMIPANHCPGSSLFLFEKTVGDGRRPKVLRVLHCGDFRACPAHVRHPLLRPDLRDNSPTARVVGQQKIDVCYLDTTYLNPKYAFPSQEQVIAACADMCVSVAKEFTDENDGWEKMKRDRAGGGMVRFIDANPQSVGRATADDHVDGMAVRSRSGGRSRGRLLVVVGTYSIGKERICLGIAQALDCKIFAGPAKQRICACLEDAELTGRLTSDPHEAQVHMTPLFEIRAETLQDYLNAYKPHFARVVGFRPSGWNYRPPNGRFVESPAVQTVLQSSSWKSSYAMADLVPQRGSTREARCFGVPYSEHSSFRELTMFCCALRIDKIIPTVNVGSAKSREKMKSWIEKWTMEKKKNGLYTIPLDQDEW